MVSAAAEQGGRVDSWRFRKVATEPRSQLHLMCSQVYNALSSADPDDASAQIDLIGVPWLMISEEPSAAPNGGSARDYLPASRGLAPRYGPTRERLSVCLFIGALGVNFRIYRSARMHHVVAACSRPQQVAAGSAAEGARQITA